MYGAAKCRAIFTAVNNRLSAREVLAILADAEPRVVVADPPAAPLVTDVGTPVPDHSAWMPQPCCWRASEINPSTHARSALPRQLLAHGLFLDAHLG